MLLIETNKPFDEYIKSLSKPARKNYKYMQKHNPDITYALVPFVREEMVKFMRLWEQQLIRGEYRQWAFPVEYVEDLYNRGELRIFGASCHGSRVSLHFIQKRDGYWECHPPMYDKEFGKGRYLAKFMWFNLIRYAIERPLAPLNLGGGLDEWREMIIHRADYPNTAYKWMYVPEDVKLNPNKYQNYIITNDSLRKID